MKEHIRKTISVDDDVLFGEINSVIKFLSGVRDQYKNGESVYLNQEWSGYENTYFEIVVERLETDKEYNNRLRAEEESEALEKEKQKINLAEKERKAEIQKQINILKKQL